MIKNLRKRIVLITLLSVGLVLGVLIVGVNVANYLQLTASADNTLDILAENRGQFPMTPSPSNSIRPEARFDTRFFSVLFDANDSVADIDVSSIFAVTKSQAVNKAIDVIGGGKTRGFDGTYRFVVVEEGTGTRVIFMDMQHDLNAFYALLSNSVLISLGGIGAVIGLSLFFSKILLVPVEEAYNKQRRFITDASHELKTPITIIKANMDVLELSVPENKWIESTNRQTYRMRDMVNDLLFLAKMDEKQSLTSQDLVDVSKLVSEVVEDYQPFLGENFELKMQIEEATCIGDKALLKRCINVVVENALRHGISHKEIAISLVKTKDKHFKFVVTNDAVIADTGSLKHIFDRFTRLDDSRNQKTGGSGIGLSIAKTIVDLHHGVIKAHSKNGSQFTITIEI